MKRGVKMVMIVIFVLCVLFAAIFVYHRICLSRESELLTPLGEQVEVNGHTMSVYTEGTGDETLVFLSGGGTCSPILDFRSLYSLLSDDYKIAVVEKFGYGFSDIVDTERDIESVLADTRAALHAAGVEAPYVLCPHSMSGIEALYWAQQYPEEVHAIVGLDMAVPKAYADYNINMFQLRLSRFAANAGITRLLPGIAESEAIRYGTLTNAEQDIYRAVFYSRTATETMLNEVESIKGSAALVEKGGIPQVPMLLFISDGTGTGWDAEVWRNYQKNYINAVEEGSFIELDCPHYVHDHAYEAISENMKLFLAELS